MQTEEVRFQSASEGHKFCCSDYCGELVSPLRSQYRQALWLKGRTMGAWNSHFQCKALGAIPNETRSNLVHWVNAGSSSLPLWNGLDCSILGRSRMVPPARAFAPSALTRFMALNRTMTVPVVTEGCSSHRGHMIDRHSSAQGWRVQLGRASPVSLCKSDTSVLIGRASVTCATAAQVRQRTAGHMSYWTVRWDYNADTVNLEDKQAHERKKKKSVHRSRDDCSG